MLAVGCVELVIIILRWAIVICVVAQQSVPVVLILQYKLIYFYFKKN